MHIHVQYMYMYIYIYTVHVCVLALCASHSGFTLYLPLIAAPNWTPFFFPSFSCLLPADALCSRISCFSFSLPSCLGKHTHMCHYLIRLLLRVATLFKELFNKPEVLSLRLYSFPQSHIVTSYKIEFASAYWHFHWADNHLICLQRIQMSRHCTGILTRPGSVYLNYVRDLDTCVLRLRCLGFR